MKRVLTGITSSGYPHLGNVLGAVLPGIRLADEAENEAYYFISDLHSLTSIKDPEKRIAYRNSIAACWLAFGLDTERHVFYRQSRLPEVCELTWYLNCFTPFPMLANAHAFKSKSEQLSDVNAGLFTYPVLMSADILLYKADLIPVGMDQRQHIEITRDIARAFNHRYGDVFVIPEAHISKETHTVKGTDGRKMSKSYNNYIDIFLPEKQLKKAVLSIETDSTPLEQPKDPDSCNVYSIYSSLANDEMKAEMRNKYEAGGFGYGHAKNELLGLILAEFGEQRRAYDELVNDNTLIESKFLKGEEKAREVSTQVICNVRDALGF